MEPPRKPVPMDAVSSQPTIGLLSITELLRHHAQTRGQKVAFSGPNRAISYADLAARTGRIASHLAAAGLRHGDRMAIVLSNRVEMAEGILAIVRAGAIGVPLDPRSSLVELTAVFAQSKACMILTDGRQLSKVREAAGARTTIVVVSPENEHLPAEGEGLLEYEDLAERDAARPPPDDLAPGEPAWLHYTSGTTGDRKGVLSSQQAWLLAEHHARPEYGLTSADCMFWPLPLFHAFGHGACIIATVAMGASAHFPGDAPLLQSLLNQPEVTTIAGVGPTFLELLATTRAASRPLPRPRLIFIGGAPASVKLRVQVEEVFGSPLLTRYGCTETCGTIAARRPGVTYAEDACGSPLPGMEVKLVSIQDQTEVADGEEGEIWVRTRSMMLGYDGDGHDGDGDRPPPIVNGWYRTGDLGRLTRPGQQLTITGRLKELIIRGGQNIHPAEVERALVTCPGVADVVVAGIPHDVFDEVPAAFIVPEPEGVELRALLRACRALLPDYKVPLSFYEIEAVPYTASGKPRRHITASYTDKPLTVRSLVPEAIGPLVLAEVAGACNLDQELLDHNLPLSEFGLHSLAAVVLRDRLAGLTGLELPTTLVFDCPTVTALSLHLRDLLFGEARSGRPVAAQPLPVPADASDNHEPIAIVSMACRYPGGIESPEDLWDVVSQGLDVTSLFPTDRGWDLDSLYDPHNLDKAGTTSVRRGGFVHNLADFDAMLFGISPREAIATDPQHRLLLETSWALLERGRFGPAAFRGSRTGVFVGHMYGDYGSRWNNIPNDLEAHLSLGSAGSVAAGRISYALGLHGPAMTIDTACSSSLVAVHLAASALRSGECSLAIAGGVSLMTTPNPFITFSRQRALASDGRCHSYSADADGTAWSEGVGLLLLEKLSDAKRNGHQVHGIIRSTAVNSDGTSNGLTAPSGPAQQQVIRQALALADLSPAEVDVIEGHGTATALGDPIEVHALMATYGQDRATPALLGSVKSNLGHTQAASGIAGMIKMIQAFKHGVAPTSLHISQPSRGIDWNSGAVELLTQARPWPQTDHPRRAAVSSFGIGGTNAHVILEQPGKYDEIQSEVAMSKTVSPTRDYCYPFLFSGADQAAMRAQAQRLAAFLDDKDVVDIDIAFSLATTRSALAYRSLVPPGNHEALIALAEGRPHPDIVTSLTKPCRLAIIFSGQGSQRLRMGKRLCDTFPAFDREFRTVCKELDPRLQRPLAEVINDNKSDQLDRVDFAQAAIFAFQVAMCRLLQSFGIDPMYVAGHSIGEVTAAYITGILTLADAAVLVTTRGKLMRDLPGGGTMASIMATEEEVAKVLSDIRSTHDGPAMIAAINSQRSVVVSGASGTVEAVMDTFRRQGRRATQLKVSHAYHSLLMEPMLDSFGEALRDIPFNKPHIPLISTVTGQPAETDQICSSEYWVRQVRAPVLFSDAVNALVGAGATCFVEVGPSPQLAIHVPGAVPACDEVDQLLNTLGRLHIQGVQVDWPAVFADSGARAVDLPIYPFQRRRYWLDPPPRNFLTAKGTLDHPILTHAAPVPRTTQIVCAGWLSLGTHPWLADHTMSGQVLFPASAFVELALRAGQEVGCSMLEELAMVAPLRIPPTGYIQIQVLVDVPTANGGRNIEIYSRPEDAATHKEWIRHATGTLSTGNQPVSATHYRALPSDTDKTVDIARAYSVLADRGVGYGPSFQCVREVHRHDQELQAHLQLPRLGMGMGTKGFLLHPALLDSALHAHLLATPANVSLHIPFLLSGVRVHSRSSGEVNGIILAHVRELGEGRIGLTLTDNTGAVVAEVASVTTRAWQPSNMNLYRLEWTRLLETTATTSAAGEGDVIIRVQGARETTSVVESVYEKTAEVLSKIQQWSTEHAHSGGRLVIVTERATVDDDDDEPDVVAAAVWGLVRSAQAEYSGQLVLVDLDGTAESAAALPIVLTSRHELCAVRAGAVMVPRLGLPHPREETSLPASTPILDVSGTVLITGGTGALGSLITRHIAHAYGSKHILLTSRSGLKAPGSRQLRDDLASNGVDVSVESCDAGNRAQLEALISRTSPPITAVIHTAGIVDDALVGSLNRDRVHEVLRPKVDAAWHLHELLPDVRSLVFFSSAAGMLGNRGQASYAAANCFLDALARLRKVRGQSAVSLAWGPWQNGGGMAGTITKMSTSGEGPLAPLTDQQGLDLFDAALKNSAEPVLVPTILRGPVQFTASRKRGFGVRASNAEAEVQLEEILWTSQLEAIPPSKRRDALQQLLRSEVSSVLGYDNNELPDQPFPELGLDSFTAILLRNRLSVLTGVRLSATIAFDHPSLPLLTDFLLSQLTLPGTDNLTEVKQGEELTSSRMQDLTNAGDVKPSNGDNVASQNISSSTNYLDLGNGFGNGYDSKSQTRHTSVLQHSHEANDMSKPPISNQPLQLHTTSTQEPVMRLASLYLQLCESGQLTSAGHLIAIASKTLSTFGPEASRAHAPSPLRLASGSAASPVLVCFPPMFPQVQGISVFDGLVAELAGRFDVFEMPYPITAIPENFATLADMHAATIRSKFPSRSILAIGFCAGGLTAHSVAGRLKSQAVGVVLIDTYRPIDGDLDRALALAAAGNVRAGNAFERVISDRAIASMGAYLSLSARWTEDSAEVPTLLLRCQARAPQITGLVDWRASWPSADCTTTTDVPGSHVTILNKDAKTTTDAIYNWLKSRIVI